MAGNREYKSDVFSMLMQDKRRALELYNAMNDTDYDNPDEVEMVTLAGGISLSVRNDASFVVGDNLSIYEHQSTVCPNMALRSLIYFVAVIKESSMASVVGVGELMYAAKIVQGSTYRSLEPLIVAAGFYFILTFTLGYF